MKTLMLTLVVCLFAASPTPATESPSTASTDKVIWRDPGPIAQRDLFWGAGSADRAPKPPYTFLRENTSGTKPKVDVKDAAGVEWSVKFTLPDPGLNEVHAEVAATRIVWAFGYLVDENYFVPTGQIEGVQGLTRAKASIAADGSFTAARFERKAKVGEARGDWNIEDNPFMGTKELSGLQTLMMLLSSWDTMPYNTAIVRVTRPDGSEEDHYRLTDLGATFGRMRGGVGTQPNRWDLAEYQKGKWVAGVVLDKFQFRTPLLGAKPLTIPLAHARWFAVMAAQLSERQIRQAFEASGATQAEIEGYTAATKARLQEMVERLKQTSDQN